MTPNTMLGVKEQMTHIANKVRFDDFGPQRADGKYWWAYSGFNYEIVVAEQTFTVRF